MLENFLGFLGIGQKKEEPVEIDPTEIADVTRQGSNRLAAQLGRMKLLDKTGTIPPEKLGEYRTVIEVMKLRAERAPTTVVDTEELDGYLSGIIQYLDAAISFGSQEVVKELMGFLSEGLADIRLGINDMTEYEQMQNMQKVRIMYDLARDMIGCLQLEKSIAEKDEAIHEKKVEYYLAVDEYKLARDKFLKDNPDDGEERWKKAAGRPLSVVEPEMVDACAKSVGVVNAKTSIKQLQQMRGVNSLSLEQRRAKINNLRLMLSNKDTNFIDPESLENMSEYEKQFEEDMRRMLKEMEAIDAEISKTDSFLEVFFEDSFFKRKQVERQEVEEMIRQDEARRLKKEQLKQQEEEHVQEQELQQTEPVKHLQTN